MSNLPIFRQFHKNPSAEETIALNAAIQLNNRALAASNAGDFDLAERLHLEALQKKLSAFGPDAITTALTWNALGELYLEMGKLKQAKENLTLALHVRQKTGPPLDLAVTRDNLGRYYEVQGDMKKSREERMAGKAKGEMICSNYKCPGQFYQLSQLKILPADRHSTTQAAFYCSKACQTTDWKRRHRGYCRAPDAD
ncbi:hypothetical protein ONZ45_g2356 [Pleurotus djamor]|nr:hypothetical protein ONZ45_g2356 [Pleurotus djamor]